MIYAATWSFKSNCKQHPLIGECVSWQLEKPKLIKKRIWECFKEVVAEET